MYKTPPWGGWSIASSRSKICIFLFGFFVKINPLTPAPRLPTPPPAPPPQKIIIIIQIWLLCKTIYLLSPPPPITPPPPQKKKIKKRKKKKKKFTYTSQFSLTFTPLKKNIFFSDLDSLKRKISLHTLATPYPFPPLPPEFILNLDSY